MKAKRPFKIVSILVILFLVIPLFLMVISAFNTSSSVSFKLQGVTLKWFVKALSSKTFIKAFMLSFKISMFATLLALILGIPVSYALWKSTSKYKVYIQNFFLSSTFIPTMVVSYALFQWILLKLKLPVFYVLLLSHLIVCFPYIIRVVNASLIQFDPYIEEVSWTLGMGKIETFLKIIIPNIGGGIISSFILAFINSFNNYPISMFLTGPGVSTLPLAILEFVEYNYDPTVSAISVLLMFITLILMIIVEKTLGLNRLKG